MFFINWTKLKKRKVTLTNSTVSKADIKKTAKIAFRKNKTIERMKDKYTLKVFNQTEFFHKKECSQLLLD